MAEGASITSGFLPQRVQRARQWKVDHPASRSSETSRKRLMPRKTQQHHSTSGKISTGSSDPRQGRKQTTDDRSFASVGEPKSKRITVAGSMSYCDAVRHPATQAQATFQGPSSDRVVQTRPLTRSTPFATTPAYAPKAKATLVLSPVLGSPASSTRKCSTHQQSHWVSKLNATSTGAKPVSHATATPASATSRAGKHNVTASGSRHPAMMQESIRLDSENSS